MKQKKKKPSRFARRLTWRIILIHTVTNLLVIVAVLLVMVVVTVTQNSLHYGAMMELTSNRLEMMLNSVEKPADFNATDIEEHIDSPEAIYNIMEKKLKESAYIMGYFSAFEPNTFSRYGRWFEPYVVKRDSVSIERMQLGSSSHDYFATDWYQKGLESDSIGLWTDPYYDNDGAHAIVCSYVVPVHNREGKAVGIFGADLPLDWLTEQIEQIEKSENKGIFTDSSNDEFNTYCFIIDRRGDYIVHPDSNTVLKKNFRTETEQTSSIRDDRVCEDMLQGGKGMKTMWQKDIFSFVYFAPIGHTGWSMAIVIPWKIMCGWGFAIGVCFLVIMGFGAIVIFFRCRHSIYKATKPLKFLNLQAQEVAKGHFDTKLPEIKHYDEIGQLRDSFEIMQKSLTQYMEQLKETTAMKASMESELRIAHDIQMAMLPKTFPPYPERSDIEIYGMLTPAKAVGGDLYDFYIRDEKLFFCIGDVSGKGVPASLVMAVTRSLFRNISAHVANPAHIVMTLNNALSENNDANMFVTMFVGVFDLTTGQLHYCNAGHDAPLIVSENDPSFFLTVDANLPVGAIPGTVFTSQETMLKAGTNIFLFTDGLSEAENERHEQFGEQRIIDITHTSSCQPQQLIEAMNLSVHAFVDGAEQSDDLTMLSIRYTRQEEEPQQGQCLVLHNDVQEVEKLSGFVEEVCEGAGVEMLTTMQINLAIEEAVVNVIDYAYPSGVQGDIRLCAIANKDTLTFVISDDGKPFDPTTRAEVDITLSAEERNIGGLGIHLVRNIMDTVSYERKDNQNVLTLIKQVKNEE